MPGLLGDPLDPLPIEPLPGEVGLVPGLVPDALLPLPPAPAPDTGAQPACADVLLDPEPTQSGFLPDCVAALLSPLDPLLPDAEGVFGSTELPEPKFPALVPEVEGVEVCADATPAASMAAAIKIHCFMFPPAVNCGRKFCKEHAYCFAFLARASSTR